MSECKVGDLAIIIKSFANNEGLIVTCLEYFPSMKFLSSPNSPVIEAPGWRIDRKLKSVVPGLETDLIRASQLKPIRPTDGEDETLSWVNLTETV